MKVIVNYDLCEANAVCMQEAPEVFEVDDDDNLNLLDEKPAEALRAKLERAVRGCPRAALKIEG